jgi:uncharacterized protein (DUF4415 family)
MYSMAKAKQKKRVKKAGKVAKLHAIGRRWRPRNLPPELAEFYRPVKKPVTIRLDADILAWFRQGKMRGYQTRINDALRTLMEAEQRKSR